MKLQRHGFLALYAGIAILFCFMACTTDKETLIWHGYRIDFIHDAPSETARVGDIIYYSYVHGMDTSTTGHSYLMGPASTVFHTDNPLPYALFLGSPGDTLRISPLDSTAKKDYPRSLIAIREIIDAKTFAERQIKKALGTIPHPLLSKKQKKEAIALSKRLKIKKDSCTFLGKGMYMCIIRKGSKILPTDGDLIAVYTMTILADKTKVVENNYTIDEPLVIQAGSDKIIDGWNYALNYIARGARVLLYIPAEEAYGEYGTSDIPPHSDLIYLMDIY